MTSPSQRLAQSDRSSLAQPCFATTQYVYGSIVSSGVKVYGVVGIDDLSTPVVSRFRESCEKTGVDGEGLEWETQMDYLSIVWYYCPSENVQSTDRIVDVFG